MDSEDRAALLREGVGGVGPIWADLGSGTGAFTFALAGLLWPSLAPSIEIYSIDRDRRALAEQERQLRARYPGLRVHFIVADLAEAAEAAGVPPLDGAVAANSLHYVRDLPRSLARILAMLRGGGRLVAVEYEGRRPSPWVPYPLPFERLRAAAEAAGFLNVRRLAQRPSDFGGIVYSAAAERGDG